MLGHIHKNTCFFVFDAHFLSQFLADFDDLGLILKHFFCSFGVFDLYYDNVIFDDVITL